MSNTGNNDYYLSQSPLASHEYTIDFDIKYDKGLVNAFVAAPNGSNPHDNGGAYSVQFTNGTEVRLFAFGGGNYATGTLDKAINDNEYHHVQIQKTNNQIIVIIDNQKVIEHTFDSTMDFFNENPHVGLGLWDGNVSFKNFIVKDSSWNTLTSLVEETIVEENYTTQSAQAYKDAIYNAKQALGDETSTQEEIAQHIQSIEEAKKQLVNVQALKQAMDISTLNKDEYTSKSWKNLEKVLQNAQSYLKSGTQEEIDACIKDLQEAKNALVKKQKEDPKPSNDKESQSNKKDTNTGVTSHLKVWTTAMVSSLAGIASILVYKKKHRK